MKQRLGDGDDQLPQGETPEAERWLEEQRGMLAASEIIFQMLDDEEGVDAGSQYSHRPPVVVKDPKNLYSP